MTTIVGQCDKCGGDVHSHENAVELMVRAGFAGPSAILEFQPRHIHPITKDGKVVCTGSPSRAQYLPGAELDDRADYPYDQEHEGPYRTGYEAMLTEAGIDAGAWDDPHAQDGVPA